MRTAPRLAVPAVTLGLVLASCGGTKVAFQEAPGAPVNLGVPGNGDALKPTTTATPTPTATQTPAAGSQSPSGTAGTATETATPTPTPSATPNVGTAGPSTGSDSTSTTEPPPAGSEAQKFEEFCQQNPGAC